MNIKVRKAIVSDVLSLYDIINEFANIDMMLPRALHELYENIRDFFVAVDTDNGEVLGCAALHVNWANLAEVKSVAVRKECQGKGVGKKLIEQCIEEAKELEVSDIFCLTYQPEFFKTLGFKIIDRTSLPRKVWGECIRCPKFNNCTETAMSLKVLDLETKAPIDPLVSLAELPKNE